MDFPNPTFLSPNCLPSSGVAFLFELPMPVNLFGLFRSSVRMVTTSLEIVVRLEIGFVIAGTDAAST